MAPRDLDTYHRERRAAVEEFNRSRLGLDRESGISHHDRRFRSVTRRDAWAMWLRRARSNAFRLAIRAFVGATAVGSSYLVIWLASPWPVGTTIHHLVAGLNCSGARALGLAPVLRGEPGYWRKNDADNDRIACEPWPRRR